MVHEDIHLNIFIFIFNRSMRLLFIGLCFSVLQKYEELPSDWRTAGRYQRLQMMTWKQSSTHSTTVVTSRFIKSTCILNHQLHASQNPSLVVFLVLTSK